MTDDSDDSDDPIGQMVAKDIISEQGKELMRTWQKFARALRIVAGSPAVTRNSL